MISLQEENAGERVMRLVDKLTLFQAVVAVVIGAVVGYSMANPPSNLVSTISLVLIRLTIYLDSAMARKSKAKIREIVENTTH